MEEARARESEGAVPEIDPVNKRRLVVVPIGLDWLISLLLRGESDIQPLRVQGMPKNAVYVGCQNDSSTLNTHLIFSHPDFDEVPPECSPPLLFIEQVRVLPDENSQ